MDGFERRRSMLTENQKIVYVKATDKRCPYCQESKLTEDIPVVTGEGIFVTVFCDFCCKSWEECYTLTSIDDE